MPIRLPFKNLHRRQVAGSRTRRRTPASVLHRVQRLEERALLSAATLGGGVEQPGATQAQDLIGFAQALSDAGVKFYGAAFCPFCTAQKELFEDGGQFLPFIEVTNPDRSLNAIGIAENISVFPTWEFQDGHRLTGLLSLETLVAESQIAIPTSAVPCFVNLPNVAVLGGSPLLVGIDGYDPNNDALTYTVTSDNPLVTAELFSGSRSMVVDVAGFGSMVFELFEDRVPRATSRFIELAQADFFDGIIFHRVINNFVIQGGDPSGTGGGGSSLGNFDDQFDVDLQHNSTGLLSMAKSGDDTNDSQFFVTEGPSRSLDFNHTIFGKLVEGEDVREAISNTATDSGDRPIFTVQMETVDIVQDTENAVLMLKAAEGASGTANITVTVTDSEGNSFLQTFTATVTPDTVNGGPFLRELPDYEVVPGESITIELNSVDVEGDPVTYVFDAGGGTETAVGNSITLDVSSAFTGEAQIVVAVRPETTSNTQDVFDLQVITLSAIETTPVVTANASDSSADEDGLNPGSIEFGGAIPVLRDDFDGTALDLSVWNLAEPGPSSIVGRTQLQTVNAPEVGGGLLRLRVDSFNPFSPGNTFSGTGISTDEAFVRGGGLVFETRARLINDGTNPLDRGLAASFFSFGLDGAARDEISLDLLSNDVLAVPDPDERVRTSSSNDEPLGQSAVAGSVGFSGLDATQFNTYRIEWQQTRVEWYVNDVLVRLETGAVPNDPMNVGLNFFAPDNSLFGNGFDASFLPDANAADNETWFFEVDFVEIRRPLTTDVTVGYSSVGSATDGSDFSTGGSSVVIGAATGTASVPVNVLQDTGIELTESATLSIDASANYTVGSPGSASVLIADDDGTAEVEVVLVLDPTALDVDGETAAVPSSEVWIDEWDEFFVEVFARVPQSDGVGVVSASFDLTYNTDYFTATDVVFGTPFTTGQSFTIDDVSGRVNSITATADRTDAGENRFVLLARVSFASTGTDQVPLNSQSDYVTPFNDFDVAIENVSVDITDAGSVVVTAGTLPQTEVWPVMYDLDDSHMVGFSDLPAFSGVFNQSTASSTDAFKADFDRDTDVDFGDVIFLATSFSRSRENTGRQTYALNFPDAWRPNPNALLASASGESAPSEAGNATALPIDADLEELAEAAVEVFRDSGLNDAAADKLDNVTIEVANLPGRQLGVAIDGRIIIDVDGAGLGWFVDSTPLDNVEFDGRGLAIDDASRNRYDLATVIAHELGHLLGLPHGAAGSLMDDTLNPGERRLTGLDEQFSESLELLNL